jgi:hypothetical protein
MTTTGSTEKSGASAGFDHPTAVDERGHDLVIENLEKLGYKQELIRVSRFQTILEH